MSYVYLAHHGIKGQKWGVRRYQNPDGTLTEEGYRYYGIQRRKFRERDNVKDTGRRSAAASAKASFKRQARIATAVTVGGAAFAALLGAPAGIAAVSLGMAYSATVAEATAIGAVYGWINGRDIAKQQNKEISKQVISGQNFVVSQLTATSAAASIGPYYHVRTGISAKR